MSSDILESVLTSEFDSDKMVRMWLFWEEHIMGGFAKLQAHYERILRNCSSKIEWLHADTIHITIKCGRRFFRNGMYDSIEIGEFEIADYNEKAMIKLIKLMINSLNTTKYRLIYVDNVKESAKNFLMSYEFHCLANGNENTYNLVYLKRN